MQRYRESSGGLGDRGSPRDTGVGSSLSFEGLGWMPGKVMGWRWAAYWREGGREGRREGERERETEIELEEEEEAEANEYGEKFSVTECKKERERERAREREVNPSHSVAHACGRSSLMGEGWVRRKKERESCPLAPQERHKEKERERERVPQAL